MDDYLLVIEKLNSINSLLCENKTKKLARSLLMLTKLSFQLVNYSTAMTSKVLKVIITTLATMMTLVVSLFLLS